MVKVTLDIPKEVNKEIEHFKVEHELNDKREAIVLMLRQGIAKNWDKTKSMEEIFKEVDMLPPVKISIEKLKKMKEGLYIR